MLSIIDNTSYEDQDYLHNIYEQYKKIMYKTARKYASNYSEIEDLVQDSITKLIPKVVKLRTLDDWALSAYIVFTVENTAKNHLRHQTISAKIICQDEYEDNITNSEISPEEALLLSEMTDEFYQIWVKLSQEDQDLLWGKYILEMSNEELGILIDCKPDSIRMKLTRARRRAMQMLEEGNFDYDTA